MDIEKLKTRWIRWLGQKTRADKPYWVTLLQSSWIGWAMSVLNKHTESRWYPPAKDREAVKDFFKLAILYSDHEDLRRLDNLYVTEKIEKGISAKAVHDMVDGTPGPNPSKNQLEWPAAAPVNCGNAGKEALADELAVSKHFGKSVKSEHFGIKKLLGELKNF